MSPHRSERRTERDSPGGDCPDHARRGDCPDHTPRGDRPDPALASRSRRRLLALAGGGGLLATAGCLSALGSSGTSNANVGLTPDRLRFPDGFAEETASLADTYGEHGVWGLADGPGVDGPTYVGAYRDSLVVPGGDHGDGDGDGDKDGDGDGSSPGEGRAPWVTADAAAVVYRLDGGSYRMWLWAGARARQPDGSLGRASVTRVSVGAIPGQAWTLEDYAPRGAAREGPVPVSLGERGPSGRTPLPGGGVAPDDGTRTGPDGGVGIAWQGIARGVRSVNAVCELRPTGGGRSGEDTPLEATVTFGVAGGRGLV